MRAGSKDPESVLQMRTSLADGGKQRLRVRATAEDSVVQGGKQRPKVRTAAEDFLG